MAALSAPTIWIPLFECTPVVVVTGYVPGADGSIYVSVSGQPPVKVGGGVSFAAGGQVFGVDATKMKAGGSVSADHAFDGETSPSSPGVELQAALAPVGPPLLVPALLECAQCVRVYGAIPGA